MREEVEAIGFARRLVSAMQQKGHVGRGRAGVDIQALARASSTSYEMARRYAEGLAIPRPEKLLAISRWLGVDTSELLFGAAGNAASELDEDLLAKCLEATLDAQRIAARPLSPTQTAAIVASLYREARSGSIPSPSTLARILLAT